MSTISWNCQGLGSSVTIPKMKDLNRKYHLELIFLMETKNGDSFCERIQEQVGMDGAFYIEMSGICGDLALWWRYNVRIQILKVSLHMIDTNVTNSHDGNLIYMTWEHADIDEHLRNQNCEELQSVSRGRRNNWVCRGDFNAITDYHEKDRGHRKSQRQINNLNQVRNEIGMEDLVSKG